MATHVSNERRRWERPEYSEVRTLPYSMQVYSSFGNMKVIDQEIETVDLESAKWCSRGTCNYVWQILACVMI